MGIAAPSEERLFGFMKPPDAPQLAVQRFVARSSVCAAPSRARKAVLLLSSEAKRCKQRFRRDPKVSPKRPQSDPFMANLDGPSRKRRKVTASFAMIKRTEDLTASGRTWPKRSQNDPILTQSSPRVALCSPRWGQTMAQELSKITEKPLLQVETSILTGF